MFIAAFATALFAAMTAWGAVGTARTIIEDGGK